MKNIYNHLHKLAKIFSQASKNFIQQNSFIYSAGIAFYTIFSLPGIVIVTVFIASAFIFENNEVKDELLQKVSSLIGTTSASQVKTLLEQRVIAGETLWVKFIGIIFLLVSTTTVFISLQNILNSILNIKPSTGKMIFTFFLNRLVSLLMVLSIGIILMISLFIDTLIAVLKNIMHSISGEISYFTGIGFNYLFSIMITIFVFASIYKVLPDAKLKWKDVWLGAMATSIFFLIGKFLIALYLVNSNVEDAYGAASSLALLLSWVYYSVLILIFGAHFTYSSIRFRGQEIQPKNGFERVDGN